MKNDLCADNPVTKTFAPKVQRRKKVYFDAEQAQALLAALKGSPIESLVRFTLATGLRLGEACGVTWENVDLARRSVLIENQLQRIDKRMRLKPLKTEKSLRTMPLRGWHVQQLRRLLEAVEVAVELGELLAGGAHLRADRVLDGGAVGVQGHDIGGRAGGDEVDVALDGLEDGLAAGAHGCS